MRQTHATIAIIGGTGFYAIDGITNVEAVEIDTPCGKPSDAFVLGELHGVAVAFVPRHGAGHRILPSELPQRANIWALASLGVERIISVSAVGSLKPEIEPLHMVVPNQLIDRTRGRPSTFFGEGVVAHIAFDEPYCAETRAIVCEAAAGSGVTSHESGTLVVIEGPAFSTRAESRLYQSWGADVIGMTALPEAKLAREAGICYATLACVTDYDTWHEGHDTVTAEMIVANLRKNVEHAKRIVSEAVRMLPRQRSCACGSSLASAMVTPFEAIPEGRRRQLEPIIARYPQAEAAR